MVKSVELKLLAEFCRFRFVLMLMVFCLVLVPACYAQRQGEISIYCHNIHSGGQGKAAANHIIDLMSMSPQKAVLLINEGTTARQYFTLPSNWTQIWPASPEEARGNPIFTRNAVAIMRDSWRMNMTEPWQHLQPKDPRVFCGAKVELINLPWVTFHCINVHFPTSRDDGANDSARQEAVDRLIAFSHLNPDLPLIICGDFNMGVSMARNRIANPIGGKIFSNASVDHMIVRDGTNVGFTDNLPVTRLGEFISDHQALRYQVNFIELGSAVGDWTLY